MERLPCKACGANSLLPMEVLPEAARALDLSENEAQEAQFFTCHVCGDNWLSVREVVEGDCTITFVHQMGMRPLLKRVAHMATPVVLSEGTVDHWAYYLGDDPVGEATWRRRLDKRRDVLRAVCSN